MSEAGDVQLALDEDFHVHSTFSDGESSLAQNVRAAQQRALRTLCLVDHVRRDTEWLPEFTAAVAPFRKQQGPRVLAGVEAKILDSSGRLDLPPGLDGIDLVLIADHQFPGDDGPVHPTQALAAITRGGMTTAEAIERLCEATANAVRAMVPEPLLAELARRVALAGAMVEINEKWACPSPRTVAAMARAGVRLVAGSDSHHCRDVGVYHSVRLTAGAGVRA
jgi:putative hydrolase